ncbi:MAG: enoyl-CoA hydratase/isomerase [Cyclobacteriaceae bacterium]
MSLVSETYQTIIVTTRRNTIQIQINRPEAENSINDELLNELIGVIRAVETDEEIKVLVIRGNKDHFCTGMDFQAVSGYSEDEMFRDNPDKYYELLQLITTSSKVVISCVEGKANAGGIGFIASSDIVLAKSDAVFSLSEALFGLIPACVMPFLIRRVGHQKAQWMAITTQSVNASRAYEIGLADEVADNIDELLRRNLLRLTRLQPATISTLKNYMNKLWIIDEDTRKLAVDQISNLVNSPLVRSNIRNFVEKGKFPWDK